MFEINDLKKDAHETARLLRMGKVLEATDNLTELTLILPEIAPTLNPKKLHELHNTSILLLAAQEKRDWASLADTLEYELTELFDNIST